MRAGAVVAGSIGDLAEVQPLQPPLLLLRAARGAPPSRVAEPKRLVESCTQPHRLALGHSALGRPGDSGGRGPSLPWPGLACVGVVGRVCWQLPSLPLPLIFPIK